MRLPRILIFTALLGLPVLPLQAAEETDPAVQDAEAMPLAPRSLLLDTVSSEGFVFVAGERGTILRRAASGDWEQLSVPTRSTLTTLAAADGVIWAAGHSGVILRSRDNGDSWVRQRLDLWTRDSEQITDGVPVLDLLFTDKNNGFAVGAFSLLLQTADGGKTWRSIPIASMADGAVLASGTADEDVLSSGALLADELVLEQETDPHLNAIVRDEAGTIFVAGERGAVFRSKDAGVTWERIAFPYEGSLFGILSSAPGHVLVFGLRGSVYESTDAGDSWSRLETGVQAALMGGATLPGGGAVIVGSEGIVLRREDAASPFIATTFTNDAGETPVLSGVLPKAAGGLLLIGEKGVVDTHGSR